MFMLLFMIGVILAQTAGSGIECIHASCPSFWMGDFGKFALVVVFMLLPGALGGMLSVLHILDTRELMVPREKEKDDSAKWDWNRFWAALGLGAAGGFGGASAMLLLGITTKQLEMTFDVQNLARFFSLGVVSGFLGFRLLKSVAEKVDKQIKENIDKLEQKQDEKMKDFRKKVFEDAGYIDQAKTALDSEESTAVELESLAEILSEMHAKDASDRRLGIVLGNLYDKLGKHTKAIAAVTEVIVEKTDKGLGKTKDVADLLFNRACYRVPLYGKAKANNDEPEMTRIISEIISDLKLSFQYFPANKNVAQQDGDLKQLVGNALYDAFMAS